VALSGEHSQNERNAALQALRDRRARVCVATDVAARGIDLPSLTLVIHVEPPRDAETLQHRSGRTGRAGKKGTAVLLVPYPRRRRIESVLRGARVTAEWVPAPSAEAIREKDRERLVAALLAPVETDEDDLAIGRQLLAERSAEEIAAALVRAHRASMPAPEELIDASTPPARREGPRPGFEDTIWFRINVGRRDNADPRWILPLLCRRGHISRGEIGAIRITQHETLFEVRGTVAEKFAAAFRRTATDDPDGEGMIAMEQVEGTPRREAKHHRRGNDGPPPQRRFDRKPGGKPPFKGKADGPRSGGGKPHRSKRPG
jgi:ATP-dependent RNA helicase DeaD